MLPLSMVDKEAFKKYIKTIDPSFVMPTRKTVKETGVPQLKNIVSEKIMNILDTIDYPNVSVDGWSDDTVRPFNGYIVQGIDNQWNLKVLSVAFKPVSGLPSISNSFNN